MPGDHRCAIILVKFCFGFAIILPLLSLLCRRVNFCLVLPLTFFWVSVLEFLVGLFCSVACCCCYFRPFKSLPIVVSLLLCCLLAALFPARDFVQAPNSSWLVCLAPNPLLLMPISDSPGGPFLILRLPLIVSISSILLVVVLLVLLLILPVFCWYY